MRRGARSFGFVPVLHRLRWLAVGAALAVGCSDSTSSDDGGGGDSSPEAEAAAPDGGEDARPADADAEAEGMGEMATFVVDEASITLDRRCDLDGDGVGDNSVADLGGSEASLYAAAMSAILAGSIEQGRRLVLHFPWIDDVARFHDEDTVLMEFRGRDTDRPEDPSDDFSGEEPFQARSNNLDGCGEPLFAFDWASLDEGTLTGEATVIGFPLLGNEVRFRAVELEGTVASGGSGLEAAVCGFATIRDLGASEEGVPATALATLSLGGAAFGVPRLPGLIPDVDMDGDGLERIVVGDDLVVESCIDGDATVIAGADCWMDDRMADAFSFAAEVTATPARFAGREPVWEHAHDGDCPGGPPEPSLFDSPVYDEGECAPTGEPCNPLFHGEPCCSAGDVCSGANQAEFTCFPPCDLQQCDYGGEVGYCLHAPGATGEQGVCRPFIVDVWSDCEPGDRGCATEHGTTESTLCVDFNGPRACFEVCERPASPCETTSSGLCLPTADGEAGVCTTWPEPSAE